MDVVEVAKAQEQVNESGPPKALKYHSIKKSVNRVSLLDLLFEEQPLRRKFKASWPYGDADRDKAIRSLEATGRSEGNPWKLPDVPGEPAVVCQRLSSPIRVPALQFSPWEDINSKKSFQKEFKDQKMSNSPMMLASPS